MVEIELTLEQRRSIVDALNSGLVEAIEYMEKECPELGPFVIRSLIVQFYRNAIEFDGTSIGIKSSALQD